MRNVGRKTEPSYPGASRSSNTGVYRPEVICTKTSFVELVHAVGNLLNMSINALRRSVKRARTMSVHPALVTPL